jgi:hypothetical protein
MSLLIHQMLKLRYGEHWHLVHLYCDVLSCCSFTDHGLAFFCSNLPEELQQAFYAYLKSRAISSDVTNFLHAYMINKECHEYLSWLRKLKGLIKSK